MNRAGFFSLTLLCGASFVFSQSSRSAAAARQVLAIDTVSVMGVNCPVSLLARPAGAGAMVETAGRTQDAAPQLQLNWENRHGKDIVAATIEVRGYDASPQIIPADLAVSPKLKKTFNLNVNLSGDGKTTTDLRVRPFASVSWIDLRSIEYADGTHWNAAAGETCRVVPSRLVLVGAQ
ncbi:hypothetical protein [Edaphobacter modestus]|uniref:Uncharacterized protein n=1 Tax=Edaphobacter modestus TaxID=388466 RepID=A0A4Q7YQJ3_9BACT|nr:hypothetical protein [Edaphobacter modestus]RZU39740.1 hypothetical protein BDD14_1133 [Edaphobacter modestus]